jgi:pilus assembly protein Flp/PilA
VACALLYGVCLEEIEMNIQDIRKHARRLVRDQRGAAITEYLIIVGLVAIICIAAYRAFGNVILGRIQNQTGQVGGI